MLRVPFGKMKDKKSARMPCSIRAVGYSIQWEQGAYHFRNQVDM